jgi:hypothetical protein
MIWDILSLDVNEAVIKKYGYAKRGILKMTVKRYGQKRTILFDEGVHS